MPPKGRIVVNEAYCKGCELCVGACPQDVLALAAERITAKGYHPAELIAEGCTGCGICAWFALKLPLPSTVKPAQAAAASGKLGGAKRMARELMKGNEAIAEAAIRAGLQAYFGYPITPQTELLGMDVAPHARAGPGFCPGGKRAGAINMVYGAACTGARVMTSSSSPGISLMMEGLSYIAGTEVPMVLVDVMRGGPGLGNIARPSPTTTRLCTAAGTAITAIRAGACQRAGSHRPDRAGL
jgi:ferredoxin